MVSREEKQPSNEALQAISVFYFFFQFFSSFLLGIQNIWNFVPYRALWYCLISISIFIIINIFLAKWEKRWVRVSPYSSTALIELSNGHFCPPFWYHLILLPVLPSCVCSSKTVSVSETFQVHPLASNLTHQLFVGTKATIFLPFSACV